MIRTFLNAVLLILIFFYGSFVCKKELLSFRETEFKKNYFADIPGKIVTRLLMLNKKIAISQFFQFRMIGCYADFDIPDENICPHCAGIEKHGKHHHYHNDPYSIKIRRIIRKYMLQHISDFFDLNRYYDFMKLTLDFDHKNYFTRMFAAHLARNSEMMQESVRVLAEIFYKYPDWEYAFDIGWLNFYCLRDYEEARKWFKKILEFRQAPRYAYNMYQATFVLEKKYFQAIKYTREQLDMTSDPEIRAQTELKLKWFESLSFLVQKAVEYKNLTARNPESLKDMIDAGLISEIPEDTIGDGFYWDKENNEPASLNNPFELVKTRNPININSIDIDHPENDVKNVGMF